MAVSGRCRRAGRGRLAPAPKHGSARRSPLRRGSKAISLSNRAYNVREFLSRPNALAASGTELSHKAGDCARRVTCPKTCPKRCAEVRFCAKRMRPLLCR
jgi:hypothetical protein